MQAPPFNLLCPPVSVSITLLFFKSSSSSHLKEGGGGREREGRRGMEGEALEGGREGGREGERERGRKGSEGGRGREGGSERRRERGSGSAGLVLPMSSVANPANQFVGRDCITIAKVQGEIT